jgi:hypothetical protein
MNVHYATDPLWAAKIAAFMNDIPQEPKRKAIPTSDYAGHWAEQTIEQVKALGLMSGYPDGTFKPDAPLTRAEMATALLALYNLLRGEA